MAYRPISILRRDVINLICIWQSQIRFSVSLAIPHQCLHSFPKPYINSWLCQIKPISPGMLSFTVYSFCFAVLCCGYTLTDFPISTRLTSLALWQSNDCPSARKQPWWIWINTSCEFIMNDCITTTKQSTTKPCAYFLGYTVYLLYDKGTSITGLSWLFIAFGVTLLKSLWECFHMKNMVSII